MEKKNSPRFYLSLHGLRKVESIMHTFCWNLLLKLVTEKFWTSMQSFKDAYNMPVKHNLICIYLKSYLIIS